MEGLLQAAPFFENRTPHREPRRATRHCVKIGTRANLLVNELVHLQVPAAIGAANDQRLWTFRIPAICCHKLIHEQDIQGNQCRMGNGFGFWIRSASSLRKKSRRRVVSASSISRAISK